MSGYWLGVRQRRMLANMLAFGDGKWPKRWTLRTDDKEILGALERKGMVAGDRYDAELTELGRKLAAAMTPERHRDVAERMVSARLSAKRRCKHSPEGHKGVRS